MLISRHLYVYVEFSRVARISLSIALWQSATHTGWDMFASILYHTVFSPTLTQIVDVESFSQRCVMVNKWLDYE